jgi:uncharacterized protein (TIGR00304 family)
MLISSKPVRYLEELWYSVPMGTLLLTIALFAVAVILVLVGMLLVLLGAMRESEEGEKKVRGGAVLVIGPIPIVFGSDKEVTKILMILAIVLTVVAAAIFVILNTGLIRSITPPNYR